MSKTTTPRAPRTGPTMRDLLDRAGLKPIDLASRARIGTATVYKAMAGVVVAGLQMWAIATVLGVSEGDLRAAILRSAKGAA